MPLDKPSNSPISNSRRQLLIRSGILGAAAAVAPGLLWPNSAQALHNGDAGVNAQQLHAALNALRDDTFFGVIACAVPGNDPYSQAQGVSTPAPGGIGTRADLYLSGGVDLLVPIPRPFMLQLLDSVGAYLAYAPIEIPPAVADTLEGDEDRILRDLDSSLSNYLEEDVSNSVLAALLLNLAASLIQDTSPEAPFLAPFSNLSWEQKTRVFAELEGKESWLKDALQWQIDDPDYRDAVPGVLQSIMAFAMRVAGFASYNEFAVFDEATRTIAQRPLGWVLSQYQPDSPPVADGSDDFIGYYQGRRSADA